MFQDDSSSRGEEFEPEPLSGLDNAWRRMSNRTNLMEITGVLMFDEPISYEALRGVLRERLVPFRRFRQRLRDRDFGRRPRWELDPAFDLDAHLHHVSLPDPKDREALCEYVGDMMSQPIDKTKPLWHFHLVDGVGDGNAVVVRIHHSVADGFALLYVLLGLADNPNDIELPIGTMPTPPHHRGSVPTPESDGGSPASNPSVSGDEPPSAPAQGLLQAAVVRAKNGLDMLRTGVRAVTLSKEPQNSLTGNLSLRKEVAWTDRVDVERVKAIGRSHDATVNDVMVAATAGAFRRYFKANDEPTDRDLRCAMPVNLKPLEERTEDLGNYFGLGFLSLPVSVDDSHERIKRVRSNTGVLKQGTEAFLLLTLLRICGRSPQLVQTLILKLFREKASAVVTNMPGPQEAISLAGNTVSKVMFWVPQSNGIGVGVSILSYDGHVRVGITADRNLVPEPFDLAEAFEAELEAMSMNPG
jgi:WS/DGAT/MGAT family acyltransferase